MGDMKGGEKKGTKNDLGDGDPPFTFCFVQIWK